MIFRIGNHSHSYRLADQSHLGNSDNPTQGQTRWTLAVSLFVLTSIAACAGVTGSGNPTPTVRVAGPTPALPAPVPGEMTAIIPTQVPTLVSTPPPSPPSVVLITTPTAQPAMAPAPMPSGRVPTGLGPLQIPLRLRIPKIKVNATVEAVGLTVDDSMDIPTNAADVAWYGLGPTPGSPGASVIAGHVDSKSGPAVFWSLENLQAGDTVEVDLTGGVSRQFVVKELGWYAADNAPLSTIFSLDGSPRLNLRSYDKRLVVYTELAKSGTPPGTALNSTTGGWMSAQALDLAPLERGNASPQCATSLRTCQ
jgi:hypothetical protein